MTNQIPNPNDQCVLLINTSQEMALVALIRGSIVVAERRWQAGPLTGRELLVVIDQLLAEQRLALADVWRVAVHAGPGRRQSALRAGVTIANVLAFAVGAELVSVAGDEAAMVREAQAVAPVASVRVRYEE